MAVSITEFQEQAQRVKRESDLDQTLENLQEKYGVVFDLHDGNINPSTFKISNKITSGDNGNDGETYIRVDKYAKSDLGKSLTMLSPRTFKTWIGYCGNLRNYMDFLTIKDYPRELVKKQHLNKNDILSIPKTKGYVPNYWALLAAGFVDKVKSDKNLLNALKANTLPLVAHNQVSSRSLCGVTLNVSGHDVKLSKYLAIIRFVETFVKNDKLFDVPYMEEWIKSCREYECDLFEGIAIDISTATQQ